MNDEELKTLLGKYAGNLKIRLEKLNDMILGWSVMLNSPELLSTDAGIVQQEMLDYIVDGIKDDAILEVKE